MEFGPRARRLPPSILGDARSAELQATMNLKIKFRESFRPFAPCILRERVSDYFGLRADEESPYMLLVAPVKEEHRTKLTAPGKEGRSADPDLRKEASQRAALDPSPRRVTHRGLLARDPDSWDEG